MGGKQRYKQCRCCHERYEIKKELLSAETDMEKKAALCGFHVQCYRDADAVDGYDKNRPRKHITYMEFPHCHVWQLVNHYTLNCCKCGKLSKKAVVHHTCPNCGEDTVAHNSVNVTCEHCGFLFNRPWQYHICEECGLKYKDHSFHNSKCPKCNHINNLQKHKRTCEESGHIYEDSKVKNSVCPECGNLNDQPVHHHICAHCGEEHKNHSPFSWKCPSCGEMNDVIMFQHDCDKCGNHYEDISWINSVCPKCNHVNNQPDVHHCCNECGLEYNDNLNSNSKCPNCGNINNPNGYINNEISAKKIISMIENAGMSNHQDFINLKRRVGKLKNITPEIMQDLVDLAHDLGIPTTQREAFYQAPLQMITVEDQGVTINHPALDTLDQFNGVSMVWYVRTADGRVLDVCRTQDGGAEMRAVLMLLHNLSQNPGLVDTDSASTRGRKQKMLKILQECGGEPVFHVVCPYTSLEEGIMLEMQHAHDTQAMFWSPEPDDQRSLHQQLILGDG